MHGASPAPRRASLLGHVDDAPGPGMCAEVGHRAWSEQRRGGVGPWWSSCIPAQGFRRIALSVAHVEDPPAEGHRPRLFIIWEMGALIILGQFDHVVISAAEAFTALFRGGRLRLRDWLV